MKLQRGWYRGEPLESAIIKGDENIEQISIKIFEALLAVNVFDSPQENPKVQKLVEQLNVVEQEVNEKFINWLQPLLDLEEANKTKAKRTKRLPNNEAIIKLPNTDADRDIWRALSAYPSWKINKNLGFRAYDGREGNTVIYQPQEVSDLVRCVPGQALELLEKKFRQNEPPRSKLRGINRKSFGLIASN